MNNMKQIFSLLIAMLIFFSIFIEPVFANEEWYNYTNEIITNQELIETENKNEAPTNKDWKTFYCITMLLVYLFFLLSIALIRFLYLTPKYLHNISRKQMKENNILVKIEEKTGNWSFIVTGILRALPLIIFIILTLVLISLDLSLFDTTPPINGSETYNLTSDGYRIPIICSNTFNIIAILLLNLTTIIISLFIDFLIEIPTKLYTIMQNVYDENIEV